MIMYRNDVSLWVCMFYNMRMWWCMCPWSECFGFPFRLTIGMTREVRVEMDKSMCNPIRRHHLYVKNILSWMVCASNSPPVQIAVCVCVCARSMCLCVMWCAPKGTVYFEWCAPERRKFSMLRENSVKRHNTDTRTHTHKQRRMYSSTRFHTQMRLRRTC